MRELGQKKSNPDALDENGENEVDRAHRLIEELIMPFGVSIVQNWEFDTRREAAFVLDHIAGSGPEVGKATQDIARELKKVSSQSSNPLFISLPSVASFCSSRWLTTFHSFNLFQDQSSSLSRSSNDLLETSL